jgi:hypothetical protein
MHLERECKIVNWTFMTEHIAKMNYGKKNNKYTIFETEAKYERASDATS